MNILVRMKGLVPSPETLGANKDHQKINEEDKGVFKSRSDEEAAQKFHEADDNSGHKRAGDGTKPPRATAT